MRPAVRHVGRLASLSRDSRAPRTGRYLDLTFAGDVRASTVGAISAWARAARQSPCFAARARRDQRCLSPGALGPPCSHARARGARHSRSTPGAKVSVSTARGPRTNRHSAEAGLDGRGDRSLEGVLEFHLRSSRPPAECRAKAHSPSAEGAPNPVERGAVHACSARSGHGASNG